MKIVAEGGWFYEAFVIQPRLGDLYEWLVIKFPAKPGTVMGEDKASGVETSSQEAERKVLSVLDEIVAQDRKK